MELLMDEAVVKRLKTKLQPGDLLYLDFEDGDGPFANTGITCRLDLSFRIISTPQDYPETGLKIYSEKLTTPVGPMMTKKSALTYFEEPTTLAVDQATSTIQMKGPGGVIASNIPLLRIDQHLAGKTHNG